MRQLGARLPVPPPAEAPVNPHPTETSSAEERPLQQAKTASASPEMAGGEATPEAAAVTAETRTERPDVERRSRSGGTPNAALRITEAPVQAPSPDESSVKPRERHRDRSIGLESLPKFEGPPENLFDHLKQEEVRMRQLGARLPDIPHREAPRDVHRDVHRYEGSRAAVAERLDFAPERSYQLTAVPRRESPSWGLMGPEREHHRSFLTVAVPAVAAILAIGAFLWSGSLRDRMRQQDAAMSALQAQNQKMADALEAMNSDRKLADVPSSSDVSQQPHSPAPSPVKQAQSQPAPQTPPAAQATTPPAQPDAEKSNPPQQSATPEKPQVAEKQQAEQQTSQQEGHREVVSQATPYKAPKTMEPAYAPEIVPPYPTKNQAQTVSGSGAGSSTGQMAGAYKEPFTVASASHPPAAPAAANTKPVITSPPASPSVANRAATAQQYSATENGLHASALAQNIEAVEGLQRHSTVPLQEFHVHEGMITKITPSLGLSVRHPDSGHGTYSLAVDGGSGSYQLRGQVNNPLVFTDNVTHREYELVVLRIADKQVYGYVRQMR